MDVDIFEADTNGGGGENSIGVAAGGGSVGEIEDACEQMTPLAVTDEDSIDTFDDGKHGKKDVSTKCVKDDTEDEIKIIFGEKKRKSTSSARNSRNSSSAAELPKELLATTTTSGKSLPQLQLKQEILSPTTSIKIEPEPSTSSSNTTIKRSHSDMDVLMSGDDEFLYGFDEEGSAVLGPMAKKIKANNNSDSDNGENIENDDEADILIWSSVDNENTNSNDENNETPPLLQSELKKSRSDESMEKPNSPVPQTSSNSSTSSTPTQIVAAASASVAITTTNNNTSISKLKPSEDPIYRKPFEMGWRREIVLRALPGSKDKGEVYYITPNGKKLRTRNEIQTHLTTGLTLENFTFSKDPLGGGPDEEIIRSAKVTGRTSEIVLGKRIPKPKGPKGSSPPPQHWSSSSKTSRGSSSSHHNNHSTSRQSSSSRLLDDSGSKSSNKTSNSKSGPSSKKGETQPCTIQCVLAMGLIPQLQCIKCLCLFHHECVGLDRNDVDFHLNLPHDLIGGRGGSGDHNIETPPKDYECASCKTKNPLKSILPEANSLQKSQLDLTTNICNINEKPPSSKGRITSNKDSTKKSINNPNIIISTATTTTTNTNTGGILSNNLNNSYQLPIINTSNNDLNIEKTAKMPQSIAVLNGRKYLVIRKSGTMQENEQELTSTTNQFEHDSGAGGSSVDNLPGRRRQTTGSAANSPQTTTLNNSFKIQRIDTFANNFFGNVSLGYDVLLQIFQYLKVQELLRAACVCRVWNVVANHRSLWKTVRMKNSQVNDWSGLAASLRRNETHHLDLRKMLCLHGTEDQMWLNFAEHIKSVVTLETIDLGRCTSDAVQNLFLTTPQLHILNAISIKSDTLNLINLSKLNNLNELRLKTNDTCNLDGDLTPLKLLTNLQHLSLTSINNLGNKNIDVLSELINLESLEIGECSNLTEKFATHILIKLTKLQRLRFEKSTDSLVTFEILKTISNMKNLQQLELVNFDIRDGFEMHIIACKYLKRLLLIPTYISQSATTNQIILSSMRKFQTLESLTWVVTMELLRVTALYVDQCESGTKDKKTFDESIPVLKPVPGTIYKNDNDDDDDDDDNENGNNHDNDNIHKTPSDIQQVEILPLSKIKEILAEGMPNTKFKIVKVAYHATWRQNYVE